jgi:hypothetical protein
MQIEGSTSINASVRMIRNAPTHPSKETFPLSVSTLIFTPQRAYELRASGLLTTKTGSEV